MSYEVCLFKTRINSGGLKTKFYWFSACITEGLTQKYANTRHQIYRSVVLNPSQIPDKIQGFKQVWGVKKK